MSRPRVLLTNDDGIRAPGIAAMWRALKEWADVVVVAPETHQSATGHGVTLREPLMTAEVDGEGDMRGIAVEGRPADCVKLALSKLYAEADLVVSGINMGANSGINVFYSGTVAAAVEGAFLGRKAIAVSQYLKRGVETDYDWSATLAMRVIKPLVDGGGVGAGEVVSINLPAVAAGEEPAGVVTVPQCVRPMDDEFERRESPRGQAYYWNTGVFTLNGSESGTDVWALRDRNVTVTPLHFDLTAHERLDRVATSLG